MAAKTFKTSKEPTNRIKGGLDPIEAGSIYATKSSRAKREKRSKKAIQEKGGKDAIMNSWKKSGQAGIKHATVVKDKAPVVMQARIDGEMYVLGDRVTYSDKMLEELEAPVMKNPAPQKHVSKVKTGGSAGYMERKRTNGRRVVQHTAKVLNP